jgi:hypothetical protein
MATPDSFLILAVRFKRRNFGWLKDKLFPAKEPVGSQPGEGRASTRALKIIGDLLAAMRSGVYTGNVWGTVLDASASVSTGSIVCAQATAAGKTLTFTYGGLTVVLTEGATGVNGFARGASNTTMAVALAACINAHPILGGLFLATNPIAGTVGLASKLPTPILTDIAMTTNDAVAFVLTQITGGNEGVAKIFIQQFWVNRNR